jgi:ParB family chromosome partitioning protein
MTTNITNIPLNKLTAWTGNVRKVQTKGFIDELAASMLAHGLQQNLLVKTDGRNFAVVAGGQRLKALRQLLSEGLIKARHPVPCRILGEDDDATELSLAENVVRDAMHPADQFDDKGMTTTDVAARFGVSEKTVAQRLKLARVSPAVMKAYRAEKLSLDQVIAFAVSDDHAAQDGVLDIAMRHSRSPQYIRHALTESDIAATDPRVTFVTLKAYEKAGGALRRDLFTEGDNGIFILDRELLDKLVLDKLKRAAKPVRDEGWKWH